MNTITRTGTSAKHPCACADGCSALTRRTFSQGHDARLVTRLRNAVQAGDMTAAEALAEVQRRGGLDGLRFKLERAIDNAARPRKSKGKKAAKRIDTFQLGEFCLAAQALTIEARVVAKVGRWEYRGEIVTYQVVEDGRISRGDTVLVFEYANKQGQPQQTVTYSRVRVDEEFAAAAREDTSDIPF